MKKQENFETRLTNLVTEISNDLNKQSCATEANHLRKIIGEDKERWRSDPNGGLTLYFPPSLQAKFRELKQLLEENGIAARFIQEAGDRFLQIGAKAGKPLTGKAQELLEKAEAAIMAPPKKKEEPKPKEEAPIKKEAPKPPAPVQEPLKQVAPRESDTPALDSQQMRMLLLKNLLAAPTPKTEGERKERLQMLLEFYRNPEVRDRFYDDHARAQKLKASLKNGLSAQETRDAREELLMLETQVLSLYKKFAEDLGKYAKTAAEKKEVSEARRILWAYTHKNLLKYSTAIGTAVDSLEAMKLRKADLEKAENYMSNSMDPRFGLVGYDLYAGAGPTGEKRAERILSTLKKSGLVEAENMRISYYYENGKKSWRVELGSEHACAYSRAISHNLIGGAPHVPVANAKEFQDNIDELFAHAVGDTTLAGSVVYQEAYRQMRSLGAEEKQYRLEFIHSAAAEALYNIINDYGAMYGISVIQQKGKDFAKGKDGIWAVIISSPKIGGVIAEGEISTDPLAEVRMDPTAEERPAPEPETVSQEGSDLKLSDAAQAWMKKNYKIDFAKLRKEYTGTSDEYQALNPISYKDWENARKLCKSIVDDAASAVEAMDKAEEAFKKDPKLKGEYDAFNSQRSKIRTVQTNWQARLDAAAKKAAELKEVSPDKVTRIPNAIGGNHSHLEYAEQVAAVNAYKAGREWRHRFEYPRYAKRVEEWLLAHNFEGITRRGSTLIIEANPARARKAETAEPTPQEQYQKAVLGPQELDYDQKQMLDYIYEAWAGPNSSFLENGNFAWSPKFSEVERARLIEATIRIIPGQQMRNVLAYIESEANSLMKGEAGSGRPLRVFISTEADAEVAMAGISLLFMAHGLKPPELRSELRADKGKRQLRMVGKPEIYVKPSSEFRFPEPNANGEVLVTHGGRTVSITVDDARKIEAALKEGKAFEVVVYKPAQAGEQKEFKKVSNARTLAAYLQERGWEHVQIKPWKKDGTGIKAMIYASELPAGYWDRPRSIFSCEVGNILEQPYELRHAVLTREKREYEQMLLLGTKGMFEFNREDSRRDRTYGKIIDSYPSYLREALPEGLTEEQVKKRIEKKDIRMRFFDQDFRAVQVREIPLVLNTPEYQTWIGYYSPRVAQNAARFLQDQLAGRGDPRVVSVISRGFRGLPQFRLYYVAVHNPASDLFENRGTYPIEVPHFKTIVPFGGTEPMEIAIGGNPRNRAVFEALLNGKAGAEHTFYMEVPAAQATEQYLMDIGAAGLFQSQNVRLSDIPESERDKYGAGRVYGQMVEVHGPDHMVVALTVTVPPIEKAPALDSRERVAIYKELENRIRSEIPVDARNPKLKSTINQLLRYAESEKLPREDDYILFDKRMGGEETARMLHSILADYPELITVSLSGDILAVSRGEVSERAEMEMKMRGPRMKEARWEYLESLRGPINESVKNRGVPYYAQKMKEKYPDSEVSVDVLPISDPGDVRAVFHDLDDSKYGRDTTDFNNWFFAFQDNNNSFFNFLRMEFLDKVARTEAGASPIQMVNGEPNLAESPSVRIMKDLALMIQGVGHNPEASPEKIFGSEFAGRIYRALNYTFPNVESLLEELSPGAGAGIMAGADFLAKQILMRDPAYGTLTTEEKQNRYRAVAKVLVFGIVAIDANELGYGRPHNLSHRNYKEYVMETIIPRINGTHPKSTFTLYEGTDREITYQVADRKAGASLGGAEKGKTFLTIPIEGNPRNVTVVGYLDDKGNPVVYPETKWKPRPIREFDSLARMGTTPGRTGGYTFLLRAKIKREGEVPKDEEKKEVIETSISPRVYVGDGYKVSGYQVYWKEDNFMFAMKQKKEYLDELRKAGIDPRVYTVTYRTVTREGEPYSLILPPRHHYDDEGVEVPRTTNRFGYPNGAYASAYADSSGKLFVFRYKDDKKRKEHEAENGYPLNAGEFLGKGFDENEIERVQIGTFSGGKIIYKSGVDPAQYDKHLTGHIRLIPSDMVELSAKEVKEFNSATAKVNPEEGYNYYRIKGLDAGAARDVEGESRTSVYMAVAETNIPEVHETKIVHTKKHFKKEEK